MTSPFPTSAFISALSGASLLYKQNQLTREGSGCLLCCARCPTLSTSWSPPPFSPARTTSSERTRASRVVSPASRPLLNLREHCCTTQHGCCSTIPFLYARVLAASSSSTATFSNAEDVLFVQLHPAVACASLQPGSHDDSCTDLQQTWKCPATSRCRPEVLLLGAGRRHLPARASNHQDFDIWWLTAPAEKVECSKGEAQL